MTTPRGQVAGLAAALEPLPPAFRDRLASRQVDPESLLVQLLKHVIRWAVEEAPAGLQRKLAESGDRLCDTVVSAEEAPRLVVFGAELARLWDTDRMVAERVVSDICHDPRLLTRPAAEVIAGVRGMLLRQPRPLRRRPPWRLRAQRRHRVTRRRRSSTRAGPDRLRPRQPGPAPARRWPARRGAR